MPEVEARTGGTAKNKKSDQDKNSGEALLEGRGCEVEGGLVLDGQAPVPGHGAEPQENGTGNNKIQFAKSATMGTQGGDGGASNAKAEKSVFVDPIAMKEKVRENLCKPVYNVADFYKTSGIWQKIARHIWFEHFTLAIIAVNALWIAIDTDLNDAEVLIAAHPVFQLAENLFCFYFSFEWLVRFMSFRRKRDGLKDAWFVFDSSLVTMMVLETWVMSIVMIASGGSGAGMGDASLLRLAKLLRLSRMARMARLLRAMPELMILIKGMVAAMRSVFFTLCLLLIFLYVAAIAFVQLTATSTIGQEKFATVPAAMYTLLLSGTFLDDLGQVAEALGNASFIFAGLFFAFVVLAALLVMNMLIGVLCEVVSAVAATEREEMLVSYVKRKLQVIVHQLDSDGGGSISRVEFMGILENKDAARALQEVGVDVVSLIDFADVIFETTDEMTFPKFMEMVLQLRGTNQASVKDIVDLRKLIRNMHISISKDLEVMHEKFDTQLTLAALGATIAPKDGGGGGGGGGGNDAAGGKVVVGEAAVPAKPDAASPDSVQPVVVVEGEQVEASPAKGVVQESVAPPETGSMLSAGTFPIKEETPSEMPPLPTVMEEENIPPAQPSQTTQLMRSATEDSLETPAHEGTPSPHSPHESPGTSSLGNPLHPVNIPLGWQHPPSVMARQHSPSVGGSTGGSPHFEFGRVLERRMWTATGACSTTRPVAVSTAAAKREEARKAAGRSNTGGTNGIFGGVATLGSVGGGMGSGRIDHFANACYRRDPLSARRDNQFMALGMKYGLKPEDWQGLLREMQGELATCIMARLGNAMTEGLIEFQKVQLLPQLGANCCDPKQAQPHVQQATPRSSPS